MGATIAAPGIDGDGVELVAAGAPPAASTRDRIVEAALGCFSEQGTTSVSMRELAEAAGVTVPGLYYHFDSKADLIRAVYRAQGFGRDGAGATLPDPGPIEAMLANEARRELDACVARREFLGLMQSETVRGDDDAREVQRALGLAWHARWRAVIGRATDLSPDADLDAATECIATFLWGLFVEYLGNHDADRVATRIDSFARLVAPGLRAPHAGEVPVAP